MTNSIKQYFELLDQLVVDEHLQEKLDDKKLYQRSRLQRVFRAVIYTSASAFALFYVLAIGFKIVFLVPVFDASMILLFLAFFGLLTYLFFSKGSALTVSNRFAIVDAKYLPLLCELPKHTLALGRLELIHGRDWFIKGFGSIVGFIDKVGLIPSILSLGALLAIPEKLPAWIFPLVILCVIFYVASWLSLERFRRLDRMISLTELALKIKDEDKKD